MDGNVPGSRNVFHDDHIFRSTTPPEVYRKGWEWTQTVWGLERLDMLQPNHRAIGIGAGRNVSFSGWVTDCEGLATDLYGNAHWSSIGGQEAGQRPSSRILRHSVLDDRTDAIEFRSIGRDRSQSVPRRDIRHRMVTLLDRAFWLARRLAMP